MDFEILSIIKNQSSSSPTSSSSPPPPPPPLPSQSTSTFMPVSSSQIFAQAAALHISQNDTIVFSRETIHLLAKFLATHGDNRIFDKLYQYAPDNLAWFWCFFDWDSQVDHETLIATQEYYVPFQTTCDLDDEELRLVNKIFSESPLIQYRYREQIMIADVYKFIEQVHKINVIPIAKALFLLYFPRFSPYMSNPLRQLVNVKLLKSNVSRVKSADSIVCSLIKSRYTNLNDYKSKVLSGTSLPSYIYTLLLENGFYTLSTTATTSTNSVAISSTNNKTNHSNDENNNNTFNTLKSSINYLSSFFNEFNTNIGTSSKVMSTMSNVSNTSDFSLIDNIKSNGLNDYCGSIETCDSVLSDNETNTSEAANYKSSPISPPKTSSKFMWNPYSTTASSSNSPTPTSTTPTDVFSQVVHQNDEDSLARYLKHSAFISSPIARYTLSKLSDTWSSNTKGAAQNAYAPMQRRHNSIIETTTSEYLESNSTSSSKIKQLQGQAQMWSGRLSPKVYHETSTYSRKVFLGGLPWDVDQSQLIQTLHKYGSVKLEIPGKDQKHPRLNKTNERTTPGYVYIIYEHEMAVQKMLSDCRRDLKNGGEHYFFTIYIAPNPLTNNKRGKAKEVEVIPWNQEDTSYVPLKNLSLLPSKIDSRSTIFVGALHGMLNAQGLAKVMSEVFGEVIHAGLDTDKYKYPIGSGRVTFRHRASYVKAIRSKYVTIKANQQECDPSPKFEKMIQMDPYLEDAKCCKCESRSTFFCRNEACLEYWCATCWLTRHDTKLPGDHNPLSRQQRPTHVI